MKADVPYHVSGFETGDRERGSPNVVGATQGEDLHNYHSPSDSGTKNMDEKTKIKRL